jgi:hypothetical protein
MGWRDLLAHPGETTDLPWIGGATLTGPVQSWKIAGVAPREHDWYTWQLQGRHVQLQAAAEPNPELLGHRETGYLVGNRFLSDQIGQLHLALPYAAAPVAHLIGDAADRFTRIVVGKIVRHGALFYHSPAMPLGPEDEVLTAYLDRVPALTPIKGVTPALDAAFQLECWHRTQTERRRAELERHAREAAEQAAREARRQQLITQLGDGAGRRALAAVDFTAAARAALAIGGAELLDDRHGAYPHERIVRYRLMGQRFECVCHARTLQIISSGICLTDEHTGVNGETWFTLESLPAVVKDADAQGRLVVFRHL